MIECSSNMSITATLELKDSSCSSELVEGRAGWCHVQIAIIDIVFSLDSVITAVGLVDNVPVMVAAIVISVIVMMLSAGTISDFIDKHPSLKILALSFLIVVGTVLIAEAFEVHVPKGYVYFAMAFSLAVEAVNIRMRTARARARKEEEAEPVQLRKDLPN